MSLSKTKNLGRLAVTISKLKNMSKIPLPAVFFTESILRKTSGLLIIVLNIFWAYLFHENWRSANYMG